MTNLQSTFVTWYYNVFAQSELFKTMDNCVEDSKWHREGSVGIHTHMVVGEYLSNTTEWKHNDVLGALVCAFHDTGKPIARLQKESEERGIYYSYGGHEIASARTWEDYVAVNWKQMSAEFNLSSNDVYIISHMIEHHRPWGLKKANKRQNLWTTVKLNGVMDQYQRMLIADNWGRIGDTSEENRLQVVAWLEEFNEMGATINLANWWHFGEGLARRSNTSAPNMWMIIGCSGTGKSTVAKDLPPGTQSFSWDDLRMEWYPSDTYAESFELSRHDDAFMSKSNSAFMEILKSGSDVCVDYTNLSAKRRRFFVDQARRNGYHCIAITMPVAKQVVIDRQTTRTDKCVPTIAVKRQYEALQQPQFGEFDEILVLNHNLLT